MELLVDRLQLLGSFRGRGGTRLCLFVNFESLCLSDASWHGPCSGCSCGSNTRNSTACTAISERDTARFIKAEHTIPRAESFSQHPHTRTRNHVTMQPKLEDCLLRQSVLLEQLPS